MHPGAHSGHFVAAAPTADLTDLTPERWFAYMGARLGAGISPSPLNADLAYLLGWLRFLQKQGRAVCPQVFKVDKLAAAPGLPHDVSVEQLRRLQQVIQVEATSSRPNVVRSGRMDLAWFLLMLHSGLRMGEVRRLKLSEIDWENHGVRIEQSKGLKDRLVPLSTPASQAPKAYLPIFRYPSARVCRAGSSRISQMVCCNGLSVGTCNSSRPRRP